MNISEKVKIYKSNGCGVHSKAKEDTYVNAFNWLEKHNYSVVDVIVSEDKKHISYMLKKDNCYTSYIVIANITD